MRNSTHLNLDLCCSKWRRVRTLQNHS